MLTDTEVGSGMLCNKKFLKKLEKVIGKSLKSNEETLKPGKWYKIFQ